jgi:hypothetical protein
MHRHGGHLTNKSLQPDIAEDNENLAGNKPAQLTLSRDLKPDLLYHFELDPKLGPPVWQPYATSFATFGNDLDAFSFATLPILSIDRVNTSHTLLSPVTETLDNQCMNTQFQMSIVAVKYRFKMVLQVALRKPLHSRSGFQSATEESLL